MTSQTLIDLQAALAAGATGNIPPPGPDTPLTGQGLGPAWSNVYDWIMAKAGRITRDVEAVTGKIGPAITTEIRGYIGWLLQAVSTYINDLEDQLLANGNAIFNALYTYASQLDAELQKIDQATAHLVGNDYELRQVILPALFQQVAQLGQRLDQERLVIEGQMQQWTQDNVTVPLLQQMQYIDDQTKQRELVLAQQQFHYTDQKFNEEEWLRIAAIQSLSNQLLILELEQINCGQPMCETMGPKTDLGKFLKALSLVGDAALLAELANLNRGGIESLLRGLQHLASGVIDDIGAIFSSGETVGQAIGKYL